MMTLNPLKTIEPIVSEILSALDMMKEIPGMGDPDLAGYEKTCLKIPDQIQSGLIRIAVVGVIKSGKSTFINSLMGKELVKRGAGVVTSITTRIRKGKKNKAGLRLKSWDEINLAIRKTLDMFPLDPSSHGGQELGIPDNFDLRREKDRAYLEKIYGSLVKGFPVTPEGIRPETLLIRNALEGYKACRDMVGADEARFTFSAKSFEQYKAFTSDPARAFYVKDVCLEVFGKAMDPHVEIADCQGADSTDPAQLAQIVKYIESVNLIVYCISSRIGLRQSDMEFLKIIQRLGLFENILFVNNCDFSEHENLEDLKHIESKIQQELGFLTPEPRVYTFSALYNLFQALGPRMSPRNAKRFELWQEDQQMIAYCMAGSTEFHGMLGRILEKNYQGLVLSNPVERLRIIAQALDKKAGILNELFCVDLDSQEKTRKKLREIQENASRLRAIVDNSIQGAVEGLRNEIESNLTQAFARDSIHISSRVQAFIRQTPMEVEPYRQRIKETGFQQILYLMFQDFKRKLDLFVLEEIVPELKKFIEAQENRIFHYFQSLLDSYQIDFLKLGNIGQENGVTISLEQLKMDTGSSHAVEIQAIKKIMGLKLPESIFTPKYTRRIQANALTGLGFQTLVQLVSSFLNQKIRFSFTPGFRQATAKIKQESLISLQHQVKGYHTSLSTLYFTPLIQAVTRDFKEKIHQRFALYESLNDDMEQVFALNQREKQVLQEKIQQIREKILHIGDALDRCWEGRPD